jgi:hypothetical protein
MKVQEVCGGVVILLGYRMLMGFLRGCGQLDKAQEAYISVETRLTQHERTWATSQKQDFASEPSLIVRRQYSQEDRLRQHPV